MQHFPLLEQLEFHEDEGFAQPLLVTRNQRILRWMLRPGQTIGTHSTPGTPFNAVVLAGEGLFAGADGLEHRVGPGSLVVFDVAEPHSVRALDSGLVFVSFMEGSEVVQPDNPGGLLGRDEES